MTARDDWAGVPAVVRAQILGYAAAHAEYHRQLEESGKVDPGVERAFLTSRERLCGVIASIMDSALRGSAPSPVDVDPRELAQRIAEIHPPVGVRVYRDAAGQESCVGTWRADKCPEWIERIAALLAPVVRSSLSPQTPTRE